MRASTSSVHTPHKHISVFGAAPDTGNLGVTALLHSILTGLQAHDDEIEITVFDNRLGVGSGTVATDGGNLRYDTVGLRRSRRLHRWESVFRYRVASHLPKTRHPGVARLRESFAAFDISGGDSFSDIYGHHRFESVMATKTLSLQLQCPLVLLPQTYGPFNSTRSARRAAEVIRSSTQVWARDERSFGVACELDPQLAEDGRGHLGVDVAFGLAPVSPKDSPTFPGVKRTDAPVVGLNVSGLLHASGAIASFGLSLDYRSLMGRLASALIAEGCHVLLVPHVGMNATSSESDRSACDALFASLEPLERSRTTIATGFETPSEAKWIISQCDWFCGARMHSTIASLSSQVPTAGIAYSDKFAGVFGSCGVTNRIFDARELETDEALAILMEAFHARDLDRRLLAETIPEVVRRSRAQIATMIDCSATSGAS